eukprot:1157634-Pelagomonas_calceolata.AAC.9
MQTIKLDQNLDNAALHANDQAGISEHPTMVLQDCLIVGLCTREEACAGGCVFWPVCRSPQCLRNTLPKPEAAAHTTVVLSPSVTKQPKTAM